MRIEFVGLRPGEKLYEERVGSDEVVDASSVERIDTVRPAVGSCRLPIDALVSQLEAAAVASADELVLTLIKDIVPTFQQVSEPEDATRPSPQSADNAMGTVGARAPLSYA